MAFNSVESIVDSVKLNNDEFQVVSTLGSFIGNLEFQKGFKDYQNDKHTHESFIYEMLSAIGEDVGTTIYDNVKRYVDYVSNVDICKVRALKSMLQLFNFKNTVLDCIDAFPLEIVHLLDVLSIDKKKLLSSGFMKPEFLENVAEDQAELTFDDLRIDLDSAFKHGSLTISSDCWCLDSESLSNPDVPQKFKKLCTRFSELNYGETSAFVRDRIFSDEEIRSRVAAVNEIDEQTDSEDERNDAAWLSAKYYVNDYSYTIVRSSQSLVAYDDSFTPLAVFGDLNTRSKILTSNGEVFQQTVGESLDEIDTSPEASQFQRDILAGIKNQNALLKVVYQNLVFTEDPARIDETKYESLLGDIFYDLLFGFLTLKYNFNSNYNGKEIEYYIYPNLGTDYFSKNYLKKYNTVNSYRDGSFDKQIDELKKQNHIQKSFDEKSIADAIEVGDQSLDDYSGAELSVVQLEFKRRNSPVDTTTVKGVVDTSMQQLPNKIAATRGTYYRVAKVLEYANFIDNYFSQSNLGGDIYAYDPNYRIVDNDDAKLVIKENLGSRAVDPAEDIDSSMVREVAVYLAKLAVYISKIREKIKLQTQKNYMKGTNLLLIYIINEWLIDYSRHNAEKFKDYPELSTVFASLSSHQFSTIPGQYSINIDENYDETEYFNIKTRNSARAQNGGQVNDRYWEKTSAESPKVMGGDGLSYKLADIEKFYLSTLNMETKLKEAGSDLQSFLSTIYDLGANDSFMHKIDEDHDEVFSSTLSNGQTAADLYDRLVSLSSEWGFFDDYLQAGSGYTWPSDTAENQLSNALETKIYKDLSDKYLVDISAIYDKHHPTLEQISSQMMQLSSSYNDFISSDYSFYYKKFENCKYCYADFSIESEAYVCPYYVGSAVDTSEMNLWTHLYNLDAWTTEENIKNWSLLCTVTYISNEVGSISSDLQAKINTDEFKKNYGFVDINALTLDEELKYVYDFLSSNIKTRKDFLLNQLQMLQTQANNCKTSYESLNNTFTNAVANFDDNNDGYHLGDSTVRWFSIDHVSGGIAKRQADPPKKKHEFIAFVKEAGMWYFGPKSDGGYDTGTTTVDPVYKSDDPILTRVKAVRAYMNAPTSKINGNPQRGLSNEGILVVCDNVETGIADLEVQFNAIVSQANSMFGTSTTFSSSDLYKNILQLVDELTLIDETFLDKDASIQKYKKHLSDIINLSARYIPVKQSFDGIFVDTEIQKYLFEFIAVRDLTFENLANLQRYRKKTDGKNFGIVKEKTQEFLTKTFMEILQRKTQLEEAIFEDGVYLKQTSGNDLEDYLSSIHVTLLRSIQNRTAAANAIINNYKSKIEQYAQTISTEISASLSLDLSSVQEFVDAKLSDLNFFQHSTYIKYNQMQLAYGGQEFCYDPYYNIKNQTHPSYQVHPYLWNIIRKVPGQTLLNAGFKSSVITDLEQQNFLANFQKYFGEYGQTIDTWKAAPNGLVDWSGYVSRYERSSNANSAGIVNEVVDYDGLFYPPAVEELMMDTAKSINSISSRQTSETMCSYVSRCLGIDSEISSKFMIDDLSVIVGQNLIDETIISALSDFTDIQTIVENLDATFLNTPLSAVSKAKVMTVVRSSVKSTFFEKYYSHLQLSESQYQRIAQQLDEYKDDIFQLASPTFKDEEYDIYKYGLDSQGNSYILLKQYNAPQPSFKEKQNTLGELWIRLANNPIAFPAFHGKNPAYYIYDASYINPSIKHLAELENDGIVYEDPKSKTVILEIASRMKYFYDFEITQNQANLILMSYNADLGSRMDPLHVQFQFSWVIPNVINTKYVQKTDLEYLTFMNSSSDTYSTVVERVDFSSNSKYGADLASMGIDLPMTLDIDTILASENGGSFYPSLVGYYVYDSSVADFVYVIKKFQRKSDASRKIVTQLYTEDITDETGKLKAQLPCFFVVRLKNGVSDDKTPASGWQLIDLGSRVPTSDNVCAGFDINSKQLTLAFTTRILAETFEDHASMDLSNLVAVQTSENEVNFYENTDGAVLEDPLAFEMNSHDVLTENITLVDFRRNSGSISKKNVHDHNWNADISYIPSYPGNSHEAKLWKKYQDADYYNVELLGMSKDIDFQAKLVNPSPNPYLDYDKLSESSEFGRVYEDYIKDYDKTYKLISNPSLNDNMISEDGSIALTFDGQTEDGRPEGFQMTIHLDTLFDSVQYSQKDYENLQVLIYNQTTLGKNPYAISPLVAFSGERKDLDYINASQDIEDSEYPLIGANTTSNVLKVTGTRTTIGTSSKFDSNYIENIKNIQCNASLDPDQPKCLNLYFIIDDVDKPAFVREGSIKILLYNPNDLTQFKYYHLLDAYGAVHCRYLKNAATDDRPDDGRGWGVFYDKSKVDSNDLSSRLQSYYINERGAKVSLKNVELSSYDCLSDVYCLRGNRNLGFKYDEELHFALSSDLYYFPTLNISYPKRPVDYVIGNKVLSRSNADLGVLRRAFTQRNLFILDLDDPQAVLDSIGKVDVPVLIDDTDDVRAFEDWLDADEDGIEHFKKYDAADPRAFEFVKFHGESSDGIESSLEVPDEQIKNRSVDYFLNWCQTELSASTLKSEDPSDQNQIWTDQVVVDISGKTFSADDLAKMLRVYANYKKEDDGTIALYFNYFNYLDSPYIKIENNLLYVDTIEGTYLKLKAGEDGHLDIVIQVRYYVGDRVFGCKNIKVLSYHIFNISDDKPKFLIQKTYQIKKDSLHIETGISRVLLKTMDQSIDLDEVDNDSLKMNVDIPIMVDSNVILAKGCKMTIMYPKEILDYKMSSDKVGYTIDDEDDASGVLVMTIDSPRMGTYMLHFRTTLTAKEMIKKRNMAYSLGFDDFEFTDVNGNGCKVTAEYGKLSVLKESISVLRAREEDETDETEPKAIPADVLGSLILVSW